MPVAPRKPHRRAGLLALAFALATLPLAACDNPPTGNHPLVHLFLGTTYDGRPIPTTTCPNAPPTDPVLDSLNFITHGSDSAVVRTVL